MSNPKQGLSMMHQCVKQVAKIIASSIKVCESDEWSDRKMDGEMLPNP